MVKRCNLLIFAINLLWFFIFSSHAWSNEVEPLAKNEQMILIKLARDTLSLYLNKQTIPSLKDYKLTNNLQKKYGVFVTLKEKANGNLRGCIGYIKGFKPLAEAVVDCAIQAATLDNRFLAMKRGEDNTVHIEISVLTSPRMIHDINEITVGKHGLIISNGYKNGILLPQVPVEWGWNRNDFLKAICKKADLPEDAWKKDSELFVFTAQVFGEN